MLDLFLTRYPIRKRMKPIGKVVKTMPAAPKTTLFKPSPPVDFLMFSYNSKLKKSPINIKIKIIIKKNDWYNY